MLSYSFIFPNFDSISSFSSSIRSTASLGDSTVVVKALTILSWSLSSESANGFEICGKLLLHVPKSLTPIALWPSRNTISLTNILEFSLAFVLGLELREYKLFAILITYFDICIFYELLELSGDIRF